MAECGILNIGTCLPEKLIEYVTSILNAPLQPLLTFIKYLLSEPIQIQLFVSLWAIIVYVLSMFYAFLIIYSGFTFMISGYDAAKRENAKEWLKNIIIMIILVQASFFIYELIIELSSILSSTTLSLIDNNFFLLTIDNTINIGLQLIFTLLYIVALLLTIVFLVIRYVIVAVGVVLFPPGIFCYFIQPLKAYGVLLLPFLGVAALITFLVASLIIFLRTSLPIAVKVIFVTILGCLAAGFMFLNLGYHLKGWIVWFRSRKITEKDKLAAFIGVKEIKDNIIYTSDNRKLAILKIEPVNFSIKPQGTQEAIISSFQKFLNSLDFPVQIIMNTESLNLSDYFREIENNAEKSFSGLFPKYKEHLEKIISQKNILNRNFYLIVPEKHDLEIQLSLCQKKLDTIGLKSSRIEDDKLRLIIEKFFNYQNG